MPFVFTADDFGSSGRANQSIARTHQAGVIAAASLMMGEAHTTEAVALAKANPSLAVGLHVVLADGKSVLPYSEIPDLVDFDRNFPRDPATTWLKYLFSRKTRRQIQKEIEAQFEAFRRTGLALSHVDGHHHQHLHPCAFKTVARCAKALGARWIRVTRESRSLWEQCCPKPALSKKAHGMVYDVLTRGKTAALKKEGFPVSFGNTFGLLETRSISKEYILKLLDLNPPGLHELFLHPGAEWNHDLEILLDPDVRREILRKKAAL